MGSGVDAWFGAAVAATITALGGIGVAVVAALAQRALARRQQRAEEQGRVDRLQSRVDRLQAERDAAVDYIWDLRSAFHGRGIDPPPWPASAGRPPWQVDGDGDSS